MRKVKFALVAIVVALTVSPRRTVVADVLVTNSGTEYEGEIKYDEGKNTYTLYKSGGSLGFPASMVKEVRKTVPTTRPLVTGAEPKTQDQISSLQNRVRALEQKQERLISSVQEIETLRTQKDAALKHAQDVAQRGIARTIIVDGRPAVSWDVSDSIREPARRETVLLTQQLKALEIQRNAADGELANIAKDLEYTRASLAKLDSTQKPQIAGTDLGPNQLTAQKVVANRLPAAGLGQQQEQPQRSADAEREMHLAFQMTMSFIAQQKSHSDEIHQRVELMKEEGITLSRLHELNQFNFGVTKSQLATLIKTLDGLSVTSQDATLQKVAASARSMQQHVQAWEAAAGRVESAVPGDQQDIMRRSKDSSEAALSDFQSIVAESVELEAKLSPNQPAPQVAPVGGQ